MQPPDTFQEHLSNRERERLIAALNSQAGRERAEQLLGEVGGWPKDGLSARLFTSQVLRDGPKAKLVIGPKVPKAHVSSGPMLIDKNPVLRDAFHGPLQLLSDRVSLAVDTAKYETLKAIEKQALGMLFGPVDGLDSKIVDTTFGLLKNAYRAAFTDIAEVPLQQAAELGSRQLMVSTGWTVTEAMERTGPWALEHANRVADHTFAVNTDALFAVMRDLDDTGESKRRSQRIIQSVWGVDRRTAKTINKKRKDAAADGTRFVQLMRGIRDVAMKSSSRRSNLIGDTESMAAFNMGRLFVIDEAVRKGLVPPSVQKVWVTAEDERTCTVCRPMDGVAVGMKEYFPTSDGNMMFPPAHPLCRCIIIPKVK